ncbi:MAG: hypothetical protein DRP85_02395 [Candidatus Makaraimicrobium thalassicum]|nr:MAG: hypothetical protein DRP85_02395 [Candidatus Omnitrophota bacterium]
MLSLEYLLEEAKSNGLPVLKKRGILREYLQVIVLHQIYKHSLGKSLFFTGGTAMRFFYNMPRFSEDLDFDTPGLNFKNFREILDSVKKGLLKEGFSAEISAEKRNNLYTAELRFKNLTELYKITDKRGLDIMIKNEVYKPSWGLQHESGVLSLYGYNFSSVLLKKGCLFSEKLCALLNRRRGRDIYDTLFMLKKKFPINEDVLEANKIKGPPRDIILRHLRSLSEKELKFLANQVKPFLFKEDDVELVLHAVRYAERFLNEYKTN